MDTSKTDSALVTIATVSQSYEAYMLKALLEEEGIVVFLQDEIFAQVLSAVSGGIKVRVSAADAEKARNLLTESGHVL
ncbi:MAG: DUF2007 domain-containing protein [Bacteroidales bacterium]|nr:DUF2007 domain-containing protein [Bacteroidales bacterium]MCL2133283.1 DUF2007 domain-containing protein [Bacteroidales bacterium]